jgi:chromosome segregation ATPase
LQENHQINDKSKVEITKKKESSPKSVSEQQIEDLNNKLKKRNSEISQLQEKLKDTEEMIQNLITDKKILDRRIRELEIMDLNLKIGNYEELKIDHSKLEHRQLITKKQLDEARSKIESQEKYVADAKEQVETMEKVINDLEKRGLKDYIRNRYPESFLQYQKGK